MNYMYFIIGDNLIDFAHRESRDSQTRKIWLLEDLNVVKYNYNTVFTVFVAMKVR